MSWTVKTHGTDYTATSSHPTEAAASDCAFKLLQYGIRIGNRIYPRETIVFIDLIEEKEDGK